MKRTKEYNEIIAILKNQRKTDKFSLGYYINGISSEYFNQDGGWKRSELLEKLVKMITTNPRYMNGLIGMQTFSQYKTWFNSLPCKLVNSNDGLVLSGTFAECSERKNKNNDNPACYSITKNWHYEYNF